MRTPLIIRFPPSSPRSSRRCCRAPPPDPGPKQGWNHSIESPLIVASGDPNHRGRDLFLNPGDPQWVIGKFAYGLIDKDLKEEKVDIWLLRNCGSSWEKLGTASTTLDNQHPAVEGVDVIFHASGTTGHGVFVAAQRLRRFAIGVDSDQYEEMPEAVLTSMRKRVDVAVFEVINAVARDRFANGYAGTTRTFGVSDGGIDWVSRGPHARHLRPEVVARVEALRARVASGEITVPGAPQ